MTESIDDKIDKESLNYIQWEVIDNGEGFIDQYYEVMSELKDNYPKYKKPECHLDVCNHAFEKVKEFFEYTEFLMDLKYIADKNGFEWMNVGVMYQTAYKDYILKNKHNVFRLASDYALLAVNDTIEDNIDYVKRCE